MIETYLVGRRQLGLCFIYVPGNSDDPANKEFLVYYKVVAHGEIPPETPERKARGDQCSPRSYHKREIIGCNFCVTKTLKLIAVGD